LIKKAEAMVNEVDAITKSVSHDPSVILHDPANRDKPLPGSGNGDKESSV
jgi:hypothetical protein